MPKKTTRKFGTLREGIPEKLVCGMPKKIGPEISVLCASTLKKIFPESLSPKKIGRQIWVLCASYLSAECRKNCANLWRLSVSLSPDPANYLILLGRSGRDLNLRPPRPERATRLGVGVKRLQHPGGV